jgi:WD40 repeat protein
VRLLVTAVAVAALLVGVAPAAAQEKAILSTQGGGFVNALAISPDNQLLAIGEPARSRMITIRDLATQAVKRDVHGLKREATALEFLDNQTLLYVTPDARDNQSFTAVVTWDVATGAVKKRVEVPGTFKKLSRGAKFIVTAADFEKGILRVTTLATEKAVVLPALGSRASSVEISADGKLVAAVRGSDERERYFINVYDVAAGKRLWERSPETTSPGRLIFTPEGKTLLYCDPLDKIWFWDAATGEPTRKPIRTRPDAPLGLSADGKLLAFRRPPGVALWSMERAEIEAILREGTAIPNWYPKVITFSPDGRLLAVGGSPGYIRVWDVPMTVRSAK